MRKNARKLLFKKNPATKKEHLILITQQVFSLIIYGKQTTHIKMFPKINKSIEKIEEERNRLANPVVNYT